MAKLTLTDISSGHLAPAVVNANNALIEAALENTLSRDGTSPNSMSAELDMNSNKVINLAAPTNSNDAARLIDVQTAVTDGNIPDQTGNSGKYLTTDGSVTSWGSLAGSFQALDATLTALAGVSTAADKVIYATGSDAFTTTDLTSFARTLLDDANAAAARSTLGLSFGKQSIWVPASGIRPRTTTGCAALTAFESATNKVNIPVLDFDQSTIEYAQFNVLMPKSWDEGTVTAKFVWASTATGNVVWTIQGLALSDDDAYDTAFGTGVDVTDGVTATGDVMHSAETSAVTIAGSPASEDLVVFQVSRKASDGADTVAADARLIGVRIYYTTNASNDD